MGDEARAQSILKDIVGLIKHIICTILRSYADES